MSETQETTIRVPLGSFGGTIARLWTWAVRILWVGGLGILALVVLEWIHLHGLLAGVHPVLAWTVTGGLGLALGALACWSCWRYWITPRVVAAPDLPELAEGWSAKQGEKYVAFAVRVLRRQRRNPHLDETTRGLIPKAIERVEAAGSRQAGVDSIARARALHEEVGREVDTIMAPLDERARKLIRRSAVEVALATAVSPSILLDSMITLSRNLDLISKLAELYYGRPGPLGTLRVARDVFGSALAAGAFEVVSERLSSAVTEMTGAWSSRLIGPLGQGVINGVVTMRIGAAARQRCRSLERSRPTWRPWRLGQYREASSALLQWVAEDVGPSVFGPLQRVVAWTGKTTETTVREGSQFVRGLGDKMKGVLGLATRAPSTPEIDAGPEADEPATPAGERLRDDPVLDSGLIER